MGVREERTVRPALLPRQVSARVAADDRGRPGNGAGLASRDPASGGTYQAPYNAPVRRRGPRYRGRASMCCARWTSCSTRSCTWCTTRTSSAGCGTCWTSMRCSVPCPCRKRAASPLVERARLHGMEEPLHLAAELVPYLVRHTGVRCADGRKHWDDVRAVWPIGCRTREPRAGTRERAGRRHGPIAAHRRAPSRSTIALAAHAAAAAGVSRCVQGDAQPGATCDKAPSRAAEG